MKNRSAVKIAIVVARFNEQFTDSLRRLCREKLMKEGVREKNITDFWVPGAFELPFAAKKVARSKKFHAVVTFGCVIKGDTAHDVYVSQWAAQGIGQVGMETGVPVMFGVLTPNNEAQAEERSRIGELNRGHELAEAALDMIDFAARKI